GWSISGLKHLDRLMDEHAERVKATGNLAAIKIALAYARTLDFEDTPFTDADRIFTAILKGEEVEARPLHDYLVHRIFERAEAFDLPVQIHTGYLAGNWGDFRWGDPAPLIPVFQKYRNVRFDLFHAAWPYSEFMGAVGSAFPNVWIDLCWAWSMNPVQMERILDEWLSCVPSNKILGFGADTRSPFPVVGYAEQARHGIANVLKKKIDTGEYDLDTAQFVARRIMHENARELFRM
ncbi:MAG: amidohydrolase family protein, partial [Candidatus Latescibacteria bacterium]|nr:amidohydrolase family protein [Candidatus Latescibacterota bacterium]